MPDDVFHLAAEQYVWWRSIGLEHWEMLAAVGVELPFRVPEAELVIRYLAEAERDRARRAKAVRKLRAA